MRTYRLHPLHKAKSLINVVYLCGLTICVQPDAQSAFFLYSISLSFRLFVTKILGPESRLSPYSFPSVSSGTTSIGYNRMPPISWRLGLPSTPILHIRSTWIPNEQTSPRRPDSMSKTCADASYHTYWVSPIAVQVSFSPFKQIQSLPASPSLAISPDRLPNFMSRCSLPLYRPWHSQTLRSELLGILMGSLSPRLAKARNKNTS